MLVYEASLADLECTQYGRQAFDNKAGWTRGSPCSILTGAVDSSPSARLLAAPGWLRLRQSLLHARCALHCTLQPLRSGLRRLTGSMPTAQAARYFPF